MSVAFEALKPGTRFEDKECDITERTYNEFTVVCHEHTSLHLYVRWSVLHSPHLPHLWTEVVCSFAFIVCPTPNTPPL